MPGVADLGIVKSGEIPQLEVEARPRARSAATTSTGRRPARHRRPRWAASPVGGLLGGRAALRRRRCACRRRRARTSRRSASCASRVQGRRRGAARGPGAASSVGTGRGAISRENGQRYIGIRMNVRGRDMGSFVDEARARGRAAGADCRPASRSSGAASSRTRSARWRACALVMPVALLITLVLLFKAFGSFSLGRADPAQRAVRAHRRRRRPLRSPACRCRCRPRSASSR